ncbi:hypothetical protein [Flavobacterium sp.]|uniref:hypothetical protein n=1 Tax=Flavobacterium sp. TaxID=239 RepID=UPI0037507100
MLDKITEKQTSKKYIIPSNLKIQKQEEINIDNDEAKEIIITAVDKNVDYFYEFWFKNDKLIYHFKYPWGSINKKWLINLDDDKEKEIVRIQGYEDRVDYVIYDISEKQQIPILYFNPVLEDSSYPNQYMWAYPNDIKDLIVNNKNELQVSLNNIKPLDIENSLPDNQKELPYIFFNGQSSQLDMKISSINKPEFMTVQSIINIVQKKLSTTSSEKNTQQWIGKYSCNFLRMKDESADPRAYAMIYIDIENYLATFKLESYLEDLNKELVVLSSNSTEIVLAEKDNKNSKFAITKNSNKFELKSDLLNKTIGEISTYELKKN